MICPTDVPPTITSHSLRYCFYKADGNDAKASVTSSGGHGIGQPLGLAPKNMAPAGMLSKLDGGSFEKDGDYNNVMVDVRFSSTLKLCYCFFEVGGNDAKASVTSGGRYGIGQPLSLAPKNMGPTGLLGKLDGGEFKKDGDDDVM